MLVRDEDDILAQCLDHLLTWCDAIHVLDTGSTDATWEIVQDKARHDARVKPFEQRRLRFHHGLRGWMFDRIRHTLEPGDWLAKLDADEFFPQTPPAFLRERVRPWEGRVDYLAYYFRLTDRDVTAWDAGVESLADRSRPIQERRRFYQVARYTEQRFFRYRRTLKWPPHCSTPMYGGHVARARIPMLHYPHRDPAQMIKRFRLRARQSAHQPKNESFHWSVEDWRKEVVSVDHPLVDRVSEVHGLGELRQWRDGEALPELDLTNHLDPWPRRWAKAAMYATAMRLLDARVPAFPDDYEPEPEPAPPAAAPDRAEPSIP